MLLAWWSNGWLAALLVAGLFWYLTSTRVNSALHLSWSLNQILASAGVLLYPSSIQGLATPWMYFLHLSLSAVIRMDSSTESPVHVLMLSIQAVCGLPPCMHLALFLALSLLSRQLPWFFMVWPYYTNWGKGRKVIRWQVTLYDPIWCYLPSSAVIFNYKLLYLIYFTATAMNDLVCVEWGVKPCFIYQAIMQNDATVKMLHRQFFSVLLQWAGAAGKFTEELCYGGADTWSLQICHHGRFTASNARFALLNSCRLTIFLVIFLNVGSFVNAMLSVYSKTGSVL